MYVGGVRPQPPPSKTKPFRGGHIIVLQDPRTLFSKPDKKNGRGKGLICQRFNDEQAFDPRGVKLPLLSQQQKKPKRNAREKERVTDHQHHDRLEVWQHVSELREHDWKNHPQIYNSEEIQQLLREKEEQMEERKRREKKKLQKETHAFLSSLKESTMKSIAIAESEAEDLVILDLKYEKVRKVLKHVMEDIESDLQDKSVALEANKGVPSKQKKISKEIASDTERLKKLQRKMEKEKEKERENTMMLEKVTTKLTNLRDTLESLEK
ncbi:histone-lysine N-methyltransferase, H3 lysine-79 specific-like, partial [Triplophysa rosa]|uniref:histone-lysine N-methyltransferase, H3 lysine-79 specific-like n=1 Tax=Triplophysa rosa TaxID=992332 RepID=UPI002545C6D2